MYYSLQFVLIKTMIPAPVIWLYSRIAVHSRCVAAAAANLPEVAFFHISMLFTNKPHTSRALHARTAVFPRIVIFHLSSLRTGKKVPGMFVGLFPVPTCRHNLKVVWLRGSTFAYWHNVVNMPLAANKGLSCTRKLNCLLQNPKVVVA